jgi:hypothetical protein
MDHSLSVGVFMCGGACGLKIFPGSVSFRCSDPNNASEEYYSEDSDFGVFSALLFPRSTVIDCLRRKDSVFLPYGQCMSGYHDTCISMYRYPARIDFNSSDGFRH